jgi:hypothetical protein
MSLILFYSKKCQNCEKLAKYIVQSNAGNLLKYACIDDPNVRRNLPQGIRTVPTIFNPGSGETYSGASAFKLIEHYFASQVRKSMNEAQQSRETPQSRQSDEHPKLPARIPQNALPQQKQQKQQQDDDDDILPFSSEMCSGEECYSFIGQENPLERNFEFLIPEQALKFSVDPMKPKTKQHPQQGNQRQQQGQPNFMELPKELQAVDIKKGKSGGDFQDKLERFQQERNSGMPQPLRRF